MKYFILLIIANVLACRPMAPEVVKTTYNKRDHSKVSTETYQDSFDVQTEDLLSELEQTLLSETLQLAKDRSALSLMDVRLVMSEIRVELRDTIKSETTVVQIVQLILEALYRILDEMGLSSNTIERLTDRVETLAQKVEERHTDSLDESDLEFKDCGEVPHGESVERIRFSTDNPFNTSCLSERQLSTCDNGVMSEFSGTYTYETCKEYKRISLEESEWISIEEQKKVTYDLDQVKQEFELAYALWKSHDVYHYRFRSEISCSFAAAKSSAYLVVAGRAITWGHYLEPAGSLDVSTTSFLSLDQQFDSIRSAIDSRAYRIKVRYDPEYGYPIHLLTDADGYSHDYCAFENTAVILPIMAKREMDSSTKNSSYTPIVTSTISEP